MDVELEEDRISLKDVESGLDLTIEGKIPKHWLLFALAVILSMLGASDDVRGLLGISWPENEFIWPFPDSGVS